MKIQPIRGTHDLYGEQLKRFNQIYKTVQKNAKIFDFKELVTPIFESTDLFKKPLGEESDVVLKEMYSFKDRNDAMLTLRPEHTTPMLRAAISNNLINTTPLKLFGMGPVFRRERPQKGRYRQFNQINFEILGSFDIMSEVDLILLANSILKKILPNKNISLHINSLGNKNTLILFKKELTKYYINQSKNLSEESIRKIESNPIRILDSKNIIDQEINKNSPKIIEFFANDEMDKFLNIQKLLKESSVNFILDPNLVRGLDYYCHTVFEFKTNELGAQNTLIGGGRYDGLIKVLGGPDTPGVGWAGGVERLILLMDDLKKNNDKIHFIIMDEKFNSYALNIINKLRTNNLNVQFDYKYNLKKSLSIANEEETKFAIIIGENEVKNNVLTLKNLENKSQETISVDRLIQILLK